MAAFFSLHLNGLNGSTCICKLLHKQAKHFFGTAKSPPVCLACCQINKGVRRPEVKQHTFPYCNHMSICRSWYTRAQHCFPSATHLCHTWTETLTACEGYSLWAGSLDWPAWLRTSVCSFCVIFHCAKAKKGRLSVEDWLQISFSYFLVQ